MRINRQDTNGVKPLLQVGELGYDNWSGGGDAGRVYVGTGSVNIPQANKAEVVAVDGKVDTHVSRVNNPHSVTKTQVGLSNVDNTSDLNKPVSTAMQNALDLKQNVLVSGSSIKTIEGQSIVGSGNIDLTKTDVGLNNVDNTSDTTKIVASAGKWTTSRLINGTVVDGTVNITTSQWGTSRNITIGNTTKSVNGSANISWSLNEIGAIGTASPAFTGIPTAPTAAVNTSTTQLATTAFVSAEIANDAIPRVTGINTAIPKFDGVSGAIQSSNILISGSDNLILPKASGGSLTVSVVDGASNTNLVLPESGTVTTTSNLVGFKNYIINGKKVVNQRALTPTDNSYNQDRWYKAGNNWFQGIEGNNNLVSGKTYTLSWIGAATASYYVGTATSATINAQTFTSIANGGNFTLTISAGQNLWIKFASDTTGSTFNFVQLEEWRIATPFENRPYGLELSLCKRYYEICDSALQGFASGAQIWAYRIPMASKRVDATLITKSFTQSNGIVSAPANGLNDTFIFSITTSAAGPFSGSLQITASAEL